MPNVLIIEDEQPAYENLKRYIDKYSADYQVLSWLTSIEQSIAWLKVNSAPDVIFLDVQLSDGSAFEIFKQVSIGSPIIFVTAFDEFSLKAFELNSVDYLLKPISLQSVSKALNKFEHYHSTKQVDNKLVNALLADIAKLHNKFTKRFLVKRAGELISLPATEILYFYTDESTFCVASNARIYSINHSLTKLTELLDPEHFFRLNRKVICHRSAIDTVARSLNNKLNITLINKPDFEVTVSREKTTEFKSWFASGV